MKKIITLSLLTLAMLFATTDAKALSPLKIGLRGGVNYADMSGGGSLDSKTGYMVGAIAKVKLPLGLFVQSGVDFSMRNMKLGDEYKSIYGHGESVTARPMYITVPVHLGYKIGLPGIGINISAGPYYGHGIGGKIKGGGQKMDFFGDNTYKKSDFGLGGKVGVEVIGLELSAGYDLGLSNIAQQAGKRKNRNAYITIGYNIF